MKLALIFLMSVLVVVATHQYFHDPTRDMPWLMPYTPAALQSLIGKYQPSILYYFTSHPPPTSAQNGNLNGVVVVPGDVGKHLNEAHQQFEFPDTQSRVKGLSLDRLSPHSNEQASAGRFLFNLFSSTGTYTNSFFKTATFTVYSSVSQTSFVYCVPSNQMLNGAAAIACRRKRSDQGSYNNGSIPLLLESDAFPIAPSETLKLVPTVLVLPSNDQLRQLSSSKDDAETASGEISADSESRKKRFFFLDKNRLVVSTTITSYSFSNSTVTVTRNLLVPAPAAPCAAVAGAPASPQCIACLPSGYIVCPAAG